MNENNLSTNQRVFGNNLQTEFHNDDYEQKSITSEQIRILKAKNRSVQFKCIYGVKLNFAQMQKVLLEIGEIVYHREKENGFVNFLEEYKDLVFCFDKAYNTLKLKGEIYDFGGERVLTLYGFFNYLKLLKRFVNTDDLVPSKLGSDTIYYIDLFTKYDKLIDPKRIGVEREKFIFGVYAGQYSEDDYKLIVEESHHLIVANFKKYCEPVLNVNNVILEPAFFSLKRL